MNLERSVCHGALPLPVTSCFYFSCSVSYNFQPCHLSKHRQLRVAGPVPVGGLALSGAAGRLGCLVPGCVGSPGGMQ